MAGGAKLGGDGKSILPRKHHVEDDDVEGRRGVEQQLERPFSGIRHDDIVTIGLQVESDAFSDVLFVVHDEDPAHDVARGSSTVKVAPRPSPSLCAKTRPPCLRAIARTI